MLGACFKSHLFKTLNLFQSRKKVLQHFHFAYCHLEYCRFGSKTKFFADMKLFKLWFYFQVLLVFKFNTSNLKRHECEVIAEFEIKYTFNAYLLRSTVLSHGIAL